MIDREVENAGVAALSAGSWWLRGARELTLPWIVEAAAQAAARLLAPPEGLGARQVALVGIDGAELDRPLRAGERCVLRVRLTRRLGAMVQIEGEVLADDAVVGRLRLALATPPDSSLSNAAHPAAERR